MFTLTGFLMFVFIAIAILLILVVLVQRGRGGGLSGAFGSGGGSTSAFGTKTGDVFTWATVILFAVFMLLAIWLNMRFPALKEDLTGVIKTEATTNPSNLQVEQISPPASRPAPSAPVVPLPATSAPATAAPAAGPATSASQPK